MCHHVANKNIGQVMKSGKEHQPKFKNGTDAYRRKSIINFALKENLKEFGWSLEPMAKAQKARKPKEQDLFNM